MLDRKDIVQRNNPVLREINEKSPLSVGNGNFAFTCDITGMQSLYDVYESVYPLCTMSNWGWHTYSDVRSRDELILTSYKFDRRIVMYPSIVATGNEDVYESLRINPHRFNLAKIALMWKDEPLKSEQISSIHQTLDLYTGIIISHFKIEGFDCWVETSCHSTKDALAFNIKGDALATGMLSVKIDFPYPSHQISGSDWNKKEDHFIECIDSTHIRRVIDQQVFFMAFSFESLSFSQKDQSILLLPQRQEVSFSIMFSLNEKKSIEASSVFKDSCDFWHNLWNHTGIIDFSRCKNRRARELERRMILSIYQLIINSTGNLPAQETGLSCNSWYGKFHLEMHLLHSLWLGAWNHPDRLINNISWYKKHLKEAKMNASRNGFQGARWPKMIGPDGIDSPSEIAVLLIWQQAHILWFLYMLSCLGCETKILDEYWEVIYETAEFMADFPLLNSKTGQYELCSPIIPVQEVFSDGKTQDPIFELVYWKVGLAMAMYLANQLEKEIPQKWQSVHDGLGNSPVANGLLQAHRKCETTYEEFGKDHPAVIFPYALWGYQDTDQEVIEDTLQAINEMWDFDTLWGWDYGFMSMCYMRMGRFDEAINLLLDPSKNNQYQANGHNFQLTRPKLPLYLPGNGSFLLALSLLCQLVKENNDLLPKDGSWNFESENIYPFFERRAYDD
jgi:hypothetical protein